MTEEEQERLDENSSTLRFAQGPRRLRGPLAVLSSTAQLVLALLVAALHLILHLSWRAILLLCCQSIDLVLAQTVQPLEQILDLR
jgi:hypothetical protein